MKKLSLLFLLTIVLSGMIFAQTITVTHPITGETVVKGAAYTVQWTKSGTMAATVKIRLWNSTNTTKILNIVDSTANNGSYLCAASMFNGVPAGNYVIRVKTTDNAVVGVSGVFHLADAPTPGTGISVTSPNGTDQWCINHTYTIHWSHTSTLAPNVKIRLFDSAGTTKILNIIDSTPNDGSYSWTIPNSIVSASYKIKVKTTNNAVEDLSAVFNIKSCSSVPPDWGRLKDLLRGLKEIWWWRHPHPPGPWPPGPNPCLSCPPEFDFAKLRELLAKAGLKEQIGVALFKDGAKFADLGKFGEAPKQPMGKMPQVVRMQKMQAVKLAKLMPLQNRLVLRNLAPVKSKALQGGKGFKLVFRNAMGDVLFEQNIALQEKNLNQMKQIR